MSQAKHIIQHQQFEIEIDQEERARAVQMQLSYLMRERLDGPLSPVLAEMTPNGTALLVDRLEVNLGEIDPFQGGQAMIEKLVKAIRDQLQVQVEQLVSLPNAGSRNVVEHLSPEESWARGILFFLENGVLPWWAEPLDETTQQEMFKRYGDKLWLSIKALLAKESLTRRRLLKQFSPTSILMILKGHPCFSALQQINALLSSSKQPGGAQLLERFWEISLIYLSQTAENAVSPAALIAYFYTQPIAGYQANTTVGDELLARIKAPVANSQQLDQLKQILLKQSNFDNRPGPNQASTTAIQSSHVAKEKDAQVSTPSSLEDEKRGQPSKNKQDKTIQEQGEEGKVNFAAKPVDELVPTTDPKRLQVRLEADAESAMNARSSKPRHQNEEERKAEAIDPKDQPNDRWPKQQLPPAIPRIEQRQDHKRSDRGITQHRPWHKPVTQGQKIGRGHLAPKFRELLEEGVFVHNAGLVILAPLIPSFLRKQGLVEDKQFVSVAAQERSIHLLQYLITGQTNTLEYELVLNKILLNWPLEQPIVSAVEMSNTEEAGAAELLDFVRSEWKALSNTSVERLQQLFLQRLSRLTFDEDHGYHLIVEQQAMDLLLNKLPWGFGMIKLPWMQHFLQVEWEC